MANFKPKRKARYTYLREKCHMAPVEAREFSKLSRKYPALKVMIRQRQGMWLAFNRLATRNDWSKTKASHEWVERLKRFYNEERYKVKTDKATGLSARVLENWVVSKNVHGRKVKPRPNPWDWYDSVFQSLPDEEKFDTPRSHRKKITAPDIDLDRITKQQWIAGLRQTAKREPWRTEELAGQAKRLGGRL